MDFEPGLENYSKAFSNRYNDLPPIFYLPFQYRYICELLSVNSLKSHEKMENQDGYITNPYYYHGMGQDIFVSKNPKLLNPSI